MLLFVSKIMFFIIFISKKIKSVKGMIYVKGKGNNNNVFATAFTVAIPKWQYGNRIKFHILWLSATL